MLGHLSAPRLLTALVAALLAAGLVSAAPASAATGPSLDRLRLLPAAVDTSEGDASVGVELHGTGTPSELVNGDVSATCTSCGGGTPPTLTTSFGQVTSEVAGDVTATYTLAVPQDTTPGTYVVDSLDLSDSSGTPVHLDDAALTTGGFPASGRTITVGRAPDPTAPTIDSVTFTPASVDVTTADATVALRLATTDLAPGITSMLATLSLVGDPTTTKSLYFTEFDEIGGGSGHATFRTFLQPTGTDVGTWQLDMVDVADAYGVHRTVTNPGGSAWPTLVVTATPDSQAPTLSPTASLAPAAVDTSTGPADTTMTLGITDDISGFAGGSVTFTSDSLDEVYGYIDPSDHTAGSTYAATVHVPARTVPGDYTATTVTLSDRAGNFADQVLASPLTLTVSTDPDTAQGPQLGSFQAALTTVNVVDPATGRPAAVFVTVTDDASGLDYGHLDYADPTTGAAQAYFDASNRVSGGPRNGTYLVQVPLSATGSYPLTGLTLTDLETNETTYDAAALGNTSITAVSQPDGADPTVAQVDVTPTTGATGAAGPSFALQVHAQDSGSGGQPSGLATVGAVFSSPGGLQQASAYSCTAFSSACLVSGSDQDGTYDLTLQLDDWAQQGTWTLSYVYVEDLAGNYVEVPGTSIGGVHTLDVTGTGDTVAPSASALAFAPSSPVDATAGTKVPIGVTTHVSDALSGVESADIELVSPGQYQDVSATLTRDDAGTGRLLDGTMSGAITLPRHAQSGTWSVYLTLRDAAGNLVALDSGQLAGLGLPGTLQVTGVPDTTGPSVSALTIDHPSVDATAGDRGVVLTAHLTDPGGPEFLSATVKNNGQPIDYIDFQPVGGSVTDRWYQATLGVGQFAHSGTWTLDDLSAYDSLGNTTTLTTSDLSTAGLDHQVVVTALGDGTPPALTSFTVAPTTLTILQGQANDVAATLHVTDAGSGFSSGLVSFENPDPSGDPVVLSFDPSDADAGGTPADATYHLTVPFPTTAEPGTWAATVSLTDAENNDGFYSGGTLPAGAPSSITVINGSVSNRDGVIHGVVTGPGGPVANAWVSGCNDDFSDCASTQTAADGSYSLTALADGTWSVDVSPPSGADLLTASGTLSNLYAQPSHSATLGFTMTAPLPLPAGSSVNGITGGVPTVFYGSPIALTTTGCTGGTATYTLTVEGALVQNNQPMTESSAGTYTATVPAPYPNHGTAAIAIHIACPSPDQDSDPTFSIYIDPSGNVLDTSGNPVSGATVTLSRADAAAGPFTVVPDGSAVMAPGNRKNPDISNGAGHYGWDVMAGYYRVRVAKSHCYAPGSFNGSTVQPYVDSPVVSIPPAVTDLDLTLDCRNLAPVVSASRTGAASVPTGTTIGFSASASDPNGSVASYAWNFGDGTSGSGASPSHSYGTAGTFVPQVTVTDDQGGTTTVGAPAVTVVAPTPPPADVTAPVSSLSALGATTLTASATVRWAGSDAVGVRSYDVRYRTAAWNKALGTYVYPVRWQNTTATSTTQAVGTGALYCFSVRARDAAGNVSGWSAERCTAKPLDDRALTSKGAWTKGKGKAFYAGTIATAKAKGASLTRAGALPGRVALVVTKGKAFGAVGVFYNGKLVKKVSLAATRTRVKQVLVLPRLTKKGTIVVKVLTAGKTVQVDGLLTSRV
jgi:hypothetical protein